jgi:hypothetical protein
VHQAVFTDVLIVGHLDVDGQSFSPIGLHKTDAASDWLLRKYHRKEDVVLFQQKIRGASEKLKKRAAALIKAKICKFSSIFSKRIS